MSVSVATDKTNTTTNDFQGSVIGTVTIGAGTSTTIGNAATDTIGGKVTISGGATNTINAKVDDNVEITGGTVKNDFKANITGTVGVRLPMR